MDGQQFSKVVRESHLVDKKLNLGVVGIIFLSVKDMARRPAAPVFVFPFAGTSHSCARLCVVQGVPLRQRVQRASPSRVVRLPPAVKVRCA